MCFQSAAVLIQSSNINMYFTVYSIELKSQSKSKNKFRWRIFLIVTTTRVETLLAGRIKKKKKKVGEKEWLLLLITGYVSLAILTFSSSSEHE